MSSVTKADLQEIHAKIDQVLAHREVRLSDIRISLVALFGAVLALGAPTAAVVANHYKIGEHIANTRIHADERKSELLGGVAYAGEVSAKERQEYYMLRALHCGVPNAAPALCASNYPDGPFPSLTVPAPSLDKGK